MSEGGRYYAARPAVDGGSSQWGRRECRRSRRGRGRERCGPVGDEWREAVEEEMSVASSFSLSS